MTTCLGQSCSFCLLCVSFVNVYQFVCASVPPFLVGCEIKLYLFILLILLYKLKWRIRSRLVLQLPIWQIAVHFAAGDATYRQCCCVVSLVATDLEINLASLTVLHLTFSADFILLYLKLCVESGL